MIISKIVGGLGNQLFQYASAKQLSIFLGQELYLDLNFFDTYNNPDVFRLDKYNVNYKIAKQEEITRLKRLTLTGLGTKVYRRLFKKPLYKNGTYHFDSNWIYKNDWNKLKKHKDIYLSGYFAREAFFYEIEDLLKKEFTLKDELNKENKQMLDIINSVDAVMLHVRRGDYVDNNFFVSQPLSYYKNGIQKIEEKVKNPVFFIFSDDLKWTRENLHINNETHYVNINDGKTDYMELVLMSSCRHAIIANSTFSWWGAWLINNQNKIVIAPEKWYTNPKRQAWHFKNKVYQKGWQKL